MRASALLAVGACSVESESVRKTVLSGGISEVMRYLAAAELDSLHFCSEVGADLSCSQRERGSLMFRVA